jgi:uncharacterized protein YciI
MRRVIRRIMAAVIVYALAQCGAVAKQDEPKFEMGVFYVCLLVKNAKWSSGQHPDGEQIMQAHVKHILGLLKEGKAVLAGPLTDDDRISGVLVMAVSSPEEARALEDADPAVKAGRFSVEVLKWWAAKGIMKAPTGPVDTGSMSQYYFGLLRRGPKWSAERTPDTEKLQAAHMANINAMAKAGKLVIAGPFENAGIYAGVFVFKVATLEEAKALAEADPAVRAGRLAVEVHPWMVPKGSLP